MPDVSTFHVDNDHEPELKKALLHKVKSEAQRGYDRVKTKVKTLRQGFSKAVTNGTKSGSGRLIVAHYEPLRRLYGGNAATEPLSFGLASHNIGQEQNVVDEVDDSFVNDGAEAGGSGAQNDHIGHHIQACGQQAQTLGEGTLCGAARPHFDGRGEG